MFAVQGYFDASVQERGVEMILAVVALVILFLGMTGRLGAFLGASIAPGAMKEN